MIIVCPNCQAQYEVAANAIGNAGRKVQCASCQTNWRAVPQAEEKKPPKPVPVPDEEDTLFEAEDEQALDTAFEQEELRNQTDKNNQNSKETGPEASSEEGAGQGPGLDPGKLAEHRRAMRRRQHLLTRNLPQARARRAGIMVIGIVLMTLLGGGLYLRDKIVEGIPDLAGLYNAVGLNINVVGLEFRDVQTVKTLKDGMVVMDVSAMLENVSGRQVSVPRILVSLMDEAGNSLYEWSVSPLVVSMRAGEWVAFETELASPPLDAVGVRLSFVDRSVSARSDLVSSTPDPAE